VGMEVSGGGLSLGSQGHAAASLGGGYVGLPRGGVGSLGVDGVFYGLGGRRSWRCGCAALGGWGAVVGGGVSASFFIKLLPVRFPLTTQPEGSIQPAEGAHDLFHSVPAALWAPLLYPPLLIFGKEVFLVFCVVVVAIHRPFKKSFNASPPPPLF